MSNGASNFATIPDPANLVTLVVNGEEYGGWKAVRIEAPPTIREWSGVGGVQRRGVYGAILRGALGL